MAGEGKKKKEKKFVLKRSVSCGCGVQKLGSMKLSCKKKRRGAFDFVVILSDCKTKDKGAAS